MINVIVTDVKYRMALAPIRELAKKGYGIIAADFENVPDKERLGNYSKYIKSKISLSESEEKFVEDVKEICKTERNILLPVNRKSLTKVIENSNELGKYCDFLVPTKKALELADDKNTICQIAKKVGVPVPKTTSLEEHKDINEMAKSVNYPCIIKYRNGEAMGKKPKDRYKIVNNEEEFIKAYTEMDKIDKNPIASDYIKGHDIGIAVVVNKEHKIVDFICYESYREYPIEGGPTCFLKTIFSRKLLTYASRLLEEIEFTGIAMLDFKGTVDKPYFLEINPRVWGSANVVDVSKSTFFESYVKAAKNEKEPVNIEKCEATYKKNIKIRFTPQSFACFMSHMKKSKHKIKIFCQYLASFFDVTVKDGLFALNDVKPYVRYILNTLKRI